MLINTFWSKSVNLRPGRLRQGRAGFADKPLTNPSADEIKRDDDDVELNAEYTTQYRSIAARANYLAADRMDIQYVVKALATSMAKPTNGDWQKLKRLGRYLVGSHV